MRGEIYLQLLTGRLLQNYERLEDMTKWKITKTLKIFRFDDWFLDGNTGFRMRDYSLWIVLGCRWM